MKPTTPYYVIDLRELDGGFASLKRALGQHWPNSIVGYSYKTNALPWIIRHFDNLGCYAEVVSSDEYELARLVGVADEKIIYNGPVKTMETFYDALSKGCIVNIDSHREIHWLQDSPIARVGVGIRVNFDLERACPGHSQCGEAGGRFGFCLENGEFERALHGIEEAGAELRGLHLHVSSKTRSLEVYRAIARTACSIVRDYGLSLTYVDVGGGFFGGVPGKPSFNDYISLLANELSEEISPQETALIIEPGISLVGAPISYVTEVTDVKKTIHGRFVVTDGSRTSIDPLMHKSSYEHVAAFKGEDDRAIIDRQVVCGFTCMEGDRLFTAVGEREFKTGDIIEYKKVGGYTMCLTPLFIRYFPDVYVDDGGDLYKVRSAWTANEFAMGDTGADS